MKAKTTEIAKRLNISERHARRLRAANDVRVEPMSRDAMLGYSRQRVARECINRAEALDSMVIGVRLTVRTETFDSGPEIDRLSDIVVGLSKAARDLRSLAFEIFPGQ